MPNFLDQLKKYGSSFGSSLVHGAAPALAGGFINGLFHQWHVDVAMITQYVNNNQSLWDGLTPETRDQLSDVSERVGKLDFITPEFLITSIRKDFPGVASLFLNWPEAAEWLGRQIEDLKAGVNGVEQ